MTTSKKQEKSVVLLSAGLDSTVNLYQAVAKGPVLLAITFDYYQKAARQEIARARKICRRLGVKHKVIRLDFFKEFTQSSLIAKKKKIPGRSMVKIDELAASRKTAKSVWVPNRNGIFLNIAAGFAESLKADVIIPGFNAEEATTFPDNTEGFLRSLDHAFYYSTGNHVKAKCYTTGLNKTQIVRLGQKLKVDWRLIWPCYHAGKNWCRECESCQRSLRALDSAGIVG